MQVYGMDITLAENECGVYIICNAEEEVEYVGTTKNLRNRLYKHHSECTVFREHMESIYFIKTEDVERSGLEKIIIGLLKPKRNIYRYQYENEWEKIMLGKKERLEYILGYYYGSIFKEGFERFFIDLEYCILYKNSINNSKLYRVQCKEVLQGKKPLIYYFPIYIQYWLTFESKNC